jgi:hypothetical protein
MPRHILSLPIMPHSALRLVCNHAGYEPLWREQLGGVWREEGKASFTWPVLIGDDERWAVRAAIDAVVADAYGLTREQYQHVLSTFSHASYRKAPALCLAAFDELKAIGLDAFSRKHDPYWDIPLNESLPKPVIDLPIPSEAEVAEGVLPGITPVARRRPRRKPAAAAVDPTTDAPELDRAVAALVIGLVGFDHGKPASLYQTAVHCAVKPQEIGKALDKGERASLRKHLQSFGALAGKLSTKPVDWVFVRTSLLNLGAIEVEGDAQNEIWSCGKKHKLLQSDFGTSSPDLAKLLMKAAKNVHGLKQDLFGRESAVKRTVNRTKA